MKTNVIKLVTSRSVKLQSFFAFLLISGSNAHAQNVRNNGTLFIKANSIVHVKSGAYSFGASGATTATRAADLTYGKLSFGAGASTSGASATHFLDGYGSVLTTAAFELPTGAGTILAPITLTPSTTDAVDAVYLNSTPLVSTRRTTVAAGLTVATTEHWRVVGSNNATIRLTWRSTSNLTSFSVNPNIANLVIVGYNGTTWTSIASTPTVGSNLTTGSITTNTAVNLSTFQFFALASTVNDCPPVVDASGTTRTWNGTWDTVPTIADNAVISTAGSPGSFSCNNLTLNADVTLTLTQSIEINRGVSGTGRIIMSSQSSVIQRDKSAAPPSIRLTKTTRIMRPFDYIYWGNPTNTAVGSILNTAQALGGATDAFDLKFRYVSGIIGSSGGWQPLGTINAGVGFIARVKNEIPFTATSAALNMTFEGTANNGDILVPIANVSSQPAGFRSHVLLANPYPSAIDAEKFLIENTNLDGVLYLWTAATQNTTGSAEYTTADYLTYSLAGVVKPSGLTTNFNGIIASGQGFKVRSLVVTGNATFTNCMRVTTNNTEFLKTREQVAAPVNRFKLNMTGANGVFSQILVAYMPEATLAYDRMYDAIRTSVNPIQLFSKLDNSDIKLAINARPVFTAEDKVSIGILIPETTVSEVLTISLTEKEGIFADSQKVYLYDTLEDTYHDFSNGNFTLSLNKDEVNRYKISYTSGTLSNPKFENNGVVAILNNKSISLKSMLPMKSLEVYDMAGRKVMTKALNGDLTTKTAFIATKGVFIVNTLLTNGAVASFKLINE